MMVNFNLDDKCDKNEIINITRTWFKEKIDLCMKYHEEIPNEDNLVTRFLMASSTGNLGARITEVAV